MASFKEIIDSSTTIYVKSIDKGELKNAIVQLNNIIKDKSINEENKNNAINALILVTVKFALVSYATSDFSHSSYETNLGVLKNISSFAEKTGKAELVALVNAGIANFDKIDNFLKDLDSLKTRLFDADGVLVETKMDVVEDVIDKLNKKLEEVPKMEKLNILPKIVMIDMYEKLTIILNGIKNKVLKAQDEIIEKNYKKIISDYGFELKDEMNLKYEAYPTINLGEGGIPNFLIIYSPLEIEVKLAAYYYEMTNNKKFLCINTQALNEKEMNILCGILDKLNTNLLIFNLTGLRGKDDEESANKKESKSILVQEKFLKKLFEYSKHNNVFVHNNTGNIEYYDYYVRLATEDNILNSYDLSYLYLTLGIQKNKTITNNIINIKAIGIIYFQYFFIISI